MGNSGYYTSVREDQTLLDGLFCHTPRQQGRAVASFWRQAVVPVSGGGRQAQHMKLTQVEPAGLERVVQIGNSVPLCCVVDSWSFLAPC